MRREHFRESFFTNGLRDGPPFEQQSLMPPTDLEKVVPDPNTLLTMTTGAAAAGSWWILQTPDMPLPANGTSLSGALSLPGRCKVPSDSGARDVKLHLNVTWTCSPTPGPELELVVSLKGDGGQVYKDWTPLGGAAVGGFFREATPGNDLVATAELRNVEMGAAVARADRIRFELSGVSREPGVCMNAPWLPQALPNPDLRFVQERNPGRVVVGGTDGQRADEDAAANPISKSTATITSFDYGGWGDLKVTAYLHDGRTIIGHLEDFPQTEGIPLPRRQEGSLVADRWLRDNGVAGKDDNADDEEVPVGDSSKGDGLTLYEEYRGFADGGVWSAGNPTRKDYFICDKIGGRSKDGIDLFEEITQLNVHGNLHTWEIKDRVVNFNHGAGPHRVDQHAVVLIAVLNESCGRAVGGPGTPKVINYASIGTGFSPTRPRHEFIVSGLVLQRDHWAASIAHELGHCCNIWHHGEENEPVVWDTVVNAEGGNVQLFESPGLTQIVRLQENGTLIPNVEWDEPYRVWMGVPQGQHGGADGCVMRYDCATSYRSRKADESHVRYSVASRELVGDILCDDTKGTGCNAPTHQPHSRYGDAHAGRGACRYQICVSDALTPPRRDLGSADD